MATTGSIKVSVRNSVVSIRLWAVEWAPAPTNDLLRKRVDKKGSLLVCVLVVDFPTALALKQRPWGEIWVLVCKVLVLVGKRVKSTVDVKLFR